MVVLAIVFTSGCGRFHTEKGIEPAWHDQEAGSFRRGVSTQTEIMALLGPPSQIISHRDGSIFYYLHEEAVGVGYIFILFNYAKLNTRYDRAIFFFDAAGVLQDYALSAPPGQVQ